ncbi:MAG TPA: DUF2135 domain-containing protein [Myxococcales bacterium]|nr:DUF2135 domain-containing protein [Myxococcales bacterium]
MLKALLAAVVAAGLYPTTNPRDSGLPVGQGYRTPVVTLTSPAGGWMVDRMMLVEGTVSDTTVDPVTLSINGARYLVRSPGGRFSRLFPAASGRNVITATAENHGGTGQAQVTCYAQIPPVPLKAVLTSDTDGVYTDLHIYEPTDASETVPGTLDATKMAHVFWANTASPSGGTFYLNEQNGDFDQPGYGPYLYVHRAPPKGVYAIATNYWPSGDKATTLATLDVTLYEGTPSELHRTVHAPLATHGTTVVLAWIDVLGDGKALIYVPGQDPAPGAPWPSNLEAAAKELQTSAGGGADFGD